MELSRHYVAVLIAIGIVIVYSFWSKTHIIRHVKVTGFASLKSIIQLKSLLSD